MTEKNCDETGVCLATVFEQSWEYVRQAQAMFWQSFTAVFALISGILYFSFEKGCGLRILGLLTAEVVSFIGQLIAIRAIIVMREHLVTINRIRLKAGLENLDVVLKENSTEITERIIPERWKTYRTQAFKLRRAETGYMLIALYVYGFIVSLLASLIIYYVIDSSYKQMSIITATTVFCLVALALYWRADKALRP